MATDAAVRPKLGVPTKLGYGIGAASFGIKDNGFRSFLVFFYNQVVGLPAFDVTIAVLIALVVDAFLDPIIGQMSDNFRSKWGRRHPFLYASAAPVAISYLLLWNPPYDWPRMATLVYLVAVAVLTRSFITVFEIPSAAMAAELTDDYDQRTSIISYRVLLAWWGGLSLYVFSLIVLFRPTAQHLDGRLSHPAYSTYAIIASSLMFVFILISAWSTHRFIPWMRQAPEKIPQSVGATFKDMVATLSNKPFLIIAVVGLFAAAAEGVGFSISLYITSYFWGLTAQQTGILGTEAYISSLAAFVIAPLIVKAFNKRGAAIVLLLATILLSALPLLLRVFGLFWENGSPNLIPTLYVLGTLRGICGITTSILIIAMIADVVEDSQLTTGRRSEGLFFAAMGFISKSVSGVGVVITGIILSMIKFPIGVAPGKVAPEILRNLALGYVPMMALLYGVALVFLFFYRITRESHAATLAKLAAIEAAAAETTAPIVS